MDFIGLLSGGKDSIYNILECVRLGHRLVCLANLQPQEQAVGSDAPDELDSFMFQTVGSCVVPSIAEAMGVELIRRSTSGRTKDTSIDYDSQQTQDSGHSEDEIVDLYELLKECKARYPSAKLLSVGAILSNYQRSRVEAVCARAQVGLLPIALLWQRGQEGLLKDMVSSGLQAVMVKVASYGLEKRHLGVPLGHLLVPVSARRARQRLGLRAGQPDLLTLARTHGLNPAGEGGEYETVVLDCPQLFPHGRVVLAERGACGPGRGGVVCHMHVSRAELQGKGEQEVQAGVERLRQEQAEAMRQGWGGVAPSLPPSSAVVSAARAGQGEGERQVLPRPLPPYGTELGSATTTAAAPSSPSVSDCSLVPSADHAGRRPPSLALVRVVHAQEEGREHGGARAYVVQAYVTPSTQEGQQGGRRGQVHLGGLRVVDGPGQQAGGEEEAEAAVHVAVCLKAASYLLTTRYGSCLPDIVFTHLYLRSMAHFQAVNSAYGAAFAGQRYPPARSTVAVCPAPAPPSPAQACRAPLVLMDALAHVGSAWSVRHAGGGSHGLRSCLHVASLSRWAPVSIGPYCQANSLGQGGALLWPAGQIGMRPETVALVPAPLPPATSSSSSRVPPAPAHAHAHAQLIQALTNLSRVLAEPVSMGGGSSLSRALALTVYIDSSAVAGPEGGLLLDSLLARARAWVVGLYGRGLPSPAASPPSHAALLALAAALGPGGLAHAAGPEHSHPALLAQAGRLTGEEEAVEGAGRVLLAETEDYEPPSPSHAHSESEEEEEEEEEGQGSEKPGYYVNPPVTLPGLDEAEEHLFPLHATAAHAPPTYLLRQAGVRTVRALLQAQEQAGERAGGRASTVSSPLLPPVLPLLPSSLLPLVPVLVPGLPRGAAVEVEAWAVSHAIEGLCGGIRAATGVVEGEGGGAVWSAHWLPSCALSAVYSLPLGLGLGWPSLHGVARAWAQAVRAANLPPWASMHVRAYCAHSGEPQEPQGEARQGSSGEGGGGGGGGGQVQQWAQVEEQVARAIRTGWAEAGADVTLGALTVIPVPAVVLPTQGGAGHTAAGLLLHCTAYDVARTSSEMWLRGHHAATHNGRVA